MNPARIKAIAVSLIAAASTSACVAPGAYYDRRPISSSYRSAPYYGNAYSTPLYSSFGIMYNIHAGSYSDGYSGGHTGYGHNGGGHGIHAGSYSDGYSGGHTGYGHNGGGHGLGHSNGHH